MILWQDDDRCSEVLRGWKGETCVIIGGGSSLTLDDVSAVSVAHSQRRVRCIAVNSAYLLAPWADVCYFADSHFWRDHYEGVAIPLLNLTAEQVRERFAAFEGQKASIKGSGGNITDDAVHILLNKNGQASGFGLSTDPRCLVDGRNSGFQALNLAILAGAKKVILLGFDAQVIDGRSHLIPNTRPTPEEAYPQYRKAMDEAKDAITKAGVEVVNCSPGSAINTWPKQRLADAL